MSRNLEEWVIYTESLVDRSPHVASAETPRWPRSPPSLHSSTASTRSPRFEDSDAASGHHPMALAVQPRRHISNQVQVLESKARLTSLRLSVLSAEPGPTVPTTPITPQEFPESRSNASSVLLGEGTLTPTQQAASSKAMTLHGQESSSTLHSHYDPERIPLTISQQTSNSSSRDFALRKGCPVVVPAESQRRHFFETSKSRARAKAKKQKADRVDLSALFPKPGTGTKSENPPYFKMHVKRPRAGTKHWFDSYEEELSDVESNNEPEMHADFAENLGNTFIHISAPVSPTGDGYQPPERRARTAKDLRSQVSGDTFHSPDRLSTLDRKQIHRHQASSLRTARSSSNPFQTANLKEESILFLSSSDDEDESPVFSSPRTRQTRATIRESLVLDSEDEADIEIGTAQTVRSQPAVASQRISAAYGATTVSDPGDKPSVKVIAPSRTSSKMAAFLAEPSPLFLDSRHDSRGSTSASSSSNSDTEALSQTSRPDTADGSMLSLPIEKSEVDKSEIIWETPDTAETGLDRRESTRLMPVTRQERMLLAAMRSKKATMRWRNTHLEDTVRWEIETPINSFDHRRPRTSADATAPAFLDLGRNNYADWASRRRSSLAGDGSQANEGHRESVTTFQTSSQRASTRFSSYPSDESPEVPGTPPTASAREGRTWRSSTGLGTHFSMSSSDYRSHSRSETDSSHIVVLDDLNDSPKNGVISPRFGSWAYDSWSDRPGIATVH